MSFRSSIVLPTVTVILSLGGSSLPALSSTSIDPILLQSPPSTETSRRLMRHRHGWTFPCQGLPNRMQVVLYDRPNESPKRLGYLVVDSAGTPRLYPFARYKDDQQPVRLMNMSLDDAQKIWSCKRLDSGNYRVEFYAWTGSAWDAFAAELRFEKSDCKEIRMAGTGITDGHWLSTWPMQGMISSKYMKAAPFVAAHDETGVVEIERR